MDSTMFSAQASRFKTSGEALAESMGQMREAITPDHVTQIGGYTTVVALVQLSDKAAVHAATAIVYLVNKHAESGDAVREAGGIPALVRLLSESADSSASEPAACALWNLAHNPNNVDAIRRAGGISSLVATLKAPPPSKAAAFAAGALQNLAYDGRANQEAIREEGGVELLVGLLQEGADSKAASMAAAALQKLAYMNTPNQHAITEAGGVPLLVRLLAAGASSKAARWAAGALAHLARDSPANRDAICEASGIWLLVEMLKAGAGTAGGDTAASVLMLLSNNATCHAPLLTALASLPTPPVAFTELMERLRVIATAQLDTAKGLPALRRAISQADYVQVAPADLERGWARLEPFERAEEEAARSLSRRSTESAMGTSGTEISHEYECPVTFEVMKDPVVASDGNSYERTTIEEILRTTALSPLTREPLTQHLVPNNALRRRIQEWEAQQEARAKKGPGKMESLDDIIDSTVEAAMGEKKVPGYAVPCGAWRKS